MQTTKETQQNFTSPSKSRETSGTIINPMTTQNQESTEDQEKMHSFECGGHTFTVAEKYELKRFLEVGPDGPECLVINKTSNQFLRIKKVEHVFHNLYFARGVIREICLKRFLNNCYFFNIFDIMQQSEAVTFPTVYLVTECMETTLHRVIYSQQHLSNAHIQYFIYQVLSAIFYLHSAGLIHRALCPEILHVNKQCDVKISDLAYVRPSQEEGDTDSGILPNLYYQSPEVLLDHEETQAMDIWAIGCILGELLGRTVLFVGNDNKTQFQDIFLILETPEEDVDFELPCKAKKFLQTLLKTNKAPWSNLFPQADPMALDLLENMLNVNPKKRFTAFECLQHPYFKDIFDLDYESICTEKFFWDYSDDSEPTREHLQTILDKEIQKIHFPTLQNNFNL